MSDSTSSNSASSKKSTEAKTSTEAKSSDSTASTSTSDSGSLNPERQKRVSKDYRDGWASIWGKKKKKEK